MYIECNQLYSLIKLELVSFHWHCIYCVYVSSSSSWGFYHYQNMYYENEDYYKVNLNNVQVSNDFIQVKFIDVNCKWVFVYVSKWIRRLSPMLRR